MAAWNPRANEIFAAALEVPDARRHAFVEQSCSADSELLRQVEAMLSAHAQAGSFLDEPVAGELLTTATAAPSSGPPLPATGSVVQALSGPEVELPARYQMEEEIARGGMGAVLRGRDTELKREIAVKVLLETHAGRTEFVQRFVEEAQIAGQLQHPGIAPIYDVGTASGKRPYFTMKLVKGQTLAKLLAERPVGHVCNVPDEEARYKRAPRDLPRMLKVFEAVCQTLGYAHDKHVIHRDLKPANIMVGTFGEVQVMDWGLAKVLASGGRQPPDSEPGTVIATVRDSDGHSGQTQAGTAMGTPGYMAPEQARGEVERIDERADVFGLGALLCEILTGQPPFPGKSKEAMRMAQKADFAGALSRLDACGADSELIALAKRCLAAEPEDRPRHAGEVADGMTAYLESVEARLRQAELERAQAQVKAIEERKRHRLTLALAASVLLTVLLGGGGYGWLWRQREAKRAETARRVDEALEKAAVLRGRAAAAAVNDLSMWVQAQSEVRRAEDLLDQGDADPALRERVAEVSDELESSRADAQRRADDAVAERRLVARLEAIRGERHERRDWGHDWEGMDRAYAEAFRDFGLDLDVVEPEEAGARLAGRRATAEIAAALDQWSGFRRGILADGKPARSWRRLVQVAARADPDPWRNRLRAMFGSPLPIVAETLKKQADDVSSLDTQPVASLHLLALLLHNAGERDRYVKVLRMAWRRFPGDFWINLRLGFDSGSGRGVDGPPREAVRFLTAAVAARPNSAVALLLLGIALGAAGKQDDAIACCRQVIELDPENRVAHLQLGSALFKQGKLDEAIACCHQIINSKQTNHWTARDAKSLSSGASRLLGQILYENKRDYEGAVNALRQAIRLNPKNADAYYHLGRVLNRQHKADEAIAALRQAIELDPKKAANAYMGLGTILCYTKHDYEGGIRAFRRVIALVPNGATGHQRLGKALFNHGKIDEAITSYRQAIKLAPKVAKAYLDLGFILCDHKHDYQGAGKIFRQATTLEPESALAHHRLGYALSMQGKLDEAITCFRKTIGLDPRNARAYYDLGLVLRKQGKLDEAVAAFRQAVMIDPKYAGAHDQLGWALRLQGKLDEAVLSCRKSIELQPREANFHNSLGVALKDQGKLDEAIAAFRRAVENNPKYAGAHDRLGWALRLQGKLDEAVLSCRKAIELQPREANFHNSLGVALKDQGKLDEAIAEYRRAIELDPNFASVRRNLAAVERMVAVRDKLPALIAGKISLRTNEELLGLNELCLVQKRYLVAARVYAAAFAAEARLADDVQAWHRYNAACCAALAAAGKGTDKLDDRERLRWRRQALSWLRADLAFYQKQAGSGQAADRALVSERMQHRQKDSDLAGIRDEEVLVKLPAEERQACEKLWADVAALLRQARAKPAAK
jgi:serine/threonine-protein kinase